VNTVILVSLVLKRGGVMAFGEVWMELAKQRADDLRMEGCRSRRYPRATKPAAAGRVGCLPAERPA
jgi:hypothetical protein